MVEPISSTRAAGSSGPEDLDLQRCIELSRDLAARVRETGYQPTLVVGIREGGALPAIAVARALGVRVQLILVQRSASRIRHTPLGRLAARMLARLYARWYWVRRLTEAVNRRGGHRVASIPTDRDLQNERVLVVDDFSASGRTLQRASEALAKQGAAELKTAVLTFFPGRAAVERAPDVILCQSWLTFSWSASSPHYPAFQRWMREHGAIETS